MYWLTSIRDGADQRQNLGAFLPPYSFTPRLPVESFAIWKGESQMSSIQTADASDHESSIERMIGAILEDRRFQFFARRQAQSVDANGGGRGGRGMSGESGCCSFANEPNTQMRYARQCHGSDDPGNNASVIHFNVETF